MYKISDETMFTFSEYSRERFCSTAIDDLIADGIIKSRDSKTLEFAIEMSKQAEYTGVHSQAAQFRYLMASFKFNKNFTHSKKINYAIRDIKNEEEKMHYLDKIIDDFNSVAKELNIA